MKVLVHTKHVGQTQWHSRYQDFVRLPVIGEYIAEHSTSDWYRIGIVVHTAYSDENDAEVFAVKVDTRKELEKAFPPGDMT